MFLSHTKVAIRNRNLLLHYIKQRGRVSRTEIWNCLSLSRPSVTVIVRQLMEEGMVVEAGNGESQGGRKPLHLELNKNIRKMYIFDWSSSLICLTNLGGDILYSQKLEFPNSITPEKLCGELLQHIEKISCEQYIGQKDIIALGVCLPGLIDPGRGLVLFSEELNWRDVNILDMLKAYTGLESFIERTGNMFAFGEYMYGRNRGVHQFLLINFEKTGIGSSIILNGELQHGSNFMSGELGHIKINRDILCTCGQRGCLEAVIRDALIRSGKVVNDEVLTLIGMGISTVVNILDPKVVVLSGAMSKYLTPKNLVCLTNIVKNMSVN